MDDGARLFVGNLPYSVTKEDLEAAFSQAGEVTDVFIVMDRETGRPRGFGFVTMSSADEAQAAIAMWNEQDMQGRNIVVNVAQPRERR